MTSMRRRLPTSGGSVEAPIASIFLRCGGDSPHQVDSWWQKTDRCLITFTTHQPGRPERSGGWKSSAASSIVDVESGQEADLFLNAGPTSRQCYLSKSANGIGCIKTDHIWVANPKSSHSTMKPLLVQQLRQHCDDVIQRGMHWTPKYP